MLTEAEKKLLISLQNNRYKKELIVFTDIGRDHDDEVAFTIMAGLLKLQLIDIKAIITSLHPALERAKLVKGVMDTLGFPNLPIGIGSNVDTSYSIQPYEFDASYLAKDDYFPKGQDLLMKAFTAAADKSLNLLIISGCTEAAMFIKNNQELVQQKVAQIVIMGGVASKQNQLQLNKGYIDPDDSYNNKVDMPAAQELFHQAQRLTIPMQVVSRFSAMACAINADFYAQLAEINVIGARLSHAQAFSINHLWKRVFLPIESTEREGLPLYCDKAWFLHTFTDNKAEYSAFDEQMDIWPYVTKLNAYDPIALLAMVFPEWFVPMIQKIEGIEHHIIGINSSETGVNKPEVIRQHLRLLAQFGMEPLSLEQIKTSNTNTTHLTQFSIFTTQNTNNRHDEEEPSCCSILIHAMMRVVGQ